jgi:Tol biopolymer transport system component
VWAKFVANGAVANLTRDSGLQITATTGINGIDISPDGSRIAFAARPKGGTEPYSMWETAAPLPGPIRKLVHERQGLRWSPDGRQITYVTAGGYTGDEMYVADADGANPKKIVPVHDGMHLHWLAWSTDGYIYFIHSLAPFNMEPSEIYRVKSTGGPLEPVVQTARRAVAPVPLPGGAGLIYAANPTGVDLGLWWRPDAGAPQRLTVGVGEDAEPRVSPDGRTLVCTLYTMRESLLRLRLDGERAIATPITEGYTGDLDPDASPSSDRIV